MPGTCGRLSSLLLGLAASLLLMWRSPPAAAAAAATRPQQERAALPGEAPAATATSGTDPSPPSPPLFPAFIVEVSRLASPGRAVGPLRAAASLPQGGGGVVLRCSPRRGSRSASAEAVAAVSVPVRHRGVFAAVRGSGGIPGAEKRPRRFPEAGRAAVAAERGEQDPSLIAGICMRLP